MTISTVPYSVELDPAEDTSGERRLWVAVLMRGIEDAMGNISALSDRPNGGAMRAAGWQAEDWIGSEDFHEVATLAGFEPEALIEQLLPMLARPVDERRKVWKRALAKAVQTHTHYTGTCGMKGCSVAISGRSRTGLCREHAHAPGICECTRCRRNGQGKWAEVAA